MKHPGSHARETAGGATPAGPAEDSAAAATAGVGGPASWRGPGRAGVFLVICRVCRRLHEPRDTGASTSTCAECRRPAREALEERAG